MATEAETRANALVRKSSTVEVPYWEDPAELDPDGLPMRIYQDRPLPPREILDKILARFRAETERRGSSEAQRTEVIDDFMDRVEAELEQLYRAQARERSIIEVEPIPPEVNSKADALGRLAVTLQQISELHDQAQELVVRARDDHGATWREVGEAAGITPQGAQVRWSEAGRDRNRRNQRSRRYPAQGERESE